MENPVLVSRDGPVRVIQINRPHKRNAINGQTAQALREAWLAFEADEDASVGILTGGDDVFCAGADLTALAELAPDVIGAYGPLGFTRLFLSKPTIAAVAGYCVAGGLEMACWCDLRIADETAIFGYFERRFGVPLVDGGTQRLPRIIGLGRALELTLTGRPVTAQEALAIGLANEVVSPGESLRRALELAHEIAAFPQMCLRHDRQAIYQGLGRSLEEGLQIEAELGAAVVSGGASARGAKNLQTWEKPK
ncbi:MAG: crotonase/enoyl-CoA hydratase family protein [Chloroflexi bacterium]|nr:crotonase/enoyl-CoA hydratase family protein [Chloroflexota bacterium]